LIPPSLILPFGIRALGVEVGHVAESEMAMMSLGKRELE